MTHEDQDHDRSQHCIEDGICKLEKQLNNPEVDVLTLGSLSPPSPQGALSRDEPIVHPPVDAPLCSNCQQLDLEFFDPSCPGCRGILNDPSTTIAQILACMRQWVPQTQRNIEGLIDQVLKRGAHVNDRDGLTDMTLLHFACKAGACGVGDAAAATRTVRSLLSKGANVNLRCKWTQMSSLHYAAYFDAAPIVQLLLETSPAIDINATCIEYNRGTALHIAASNLCHETVQILLQFGARLNARDALGRTPKDCVPSAEEFNPIPQVRETVEAIKQLLTSQNGSAKSAAKSVGLCEPVSGRALLKSMDLHYGSRVLVAGVKCGTLRFCGTTEFAVGLWIGVELDTADGKNNGSINGVLYFKCQPNHGIFVPINKISRLSGGAPPSRKPSSRLSISPAVKHTKMDFSKVTSKIETGLAPLKHLPRTPEGEELPGLFKEGERVLIAGNRKGTVRYYGPTKFSPGNWYGIELDLCEGKHDGLVQGERYFICPPNHGVFSHPSRVSKLLTASYEGLFAPGASAAASCNIGANGARTTNGSPENGFSNAKLLSPFKRSPFHASFRIKTPTRSPRRVSRRLEVSQLAQGPSSSGCCLAIGVNALVNNEIGIIKYIGPVDFSEGTWIGVELRQPHGKNSGTVNGKQYFSCKVNHGLLVRPQKVTVHGINGLKLLDDC